MRSRVRRYVPSYLTRRGRGVYPGFFRCFSDVSVPLADDKISNDKLVQFGQIFLRKVKTSDFIVETLSTFSVNISLNRSSFEKSFRLFEVE